LEKKIEQYSLDSHPAYRVYMSAEPAGSRETHTIPQGILEVSIKITNEPPTGMMANLHKALDNFNQVRRREFSAPLVCFVFFRHGSIRIVMSVYVSVCLSGSFSRSQVFFFFIIAACSLLFLSFVRVLRSSFHTHISGTTRPNFTKFFRAY